MPYFKKSDEKLTLDGKIIEEGKTYLGVSYYSELGEFECSSFVDSQGEIWLELRDFLGNVCGLDNNYPNSKHWPIIEKTSI